MTVFLLFVLSIMVMVILAKRKKQQSAKREAYIRSFAFPQGILRKVHNKHPQLSQKELELASLGLRHFFLAYLKSGYQPVAMPSQVADDLWHEFILYTLKYQNFCKQAFGRFLHHQPAETLSSQKKSNLALRRVWQQTCAEEIINPRNPSRLPLLFALDAKLAIVGGFTYIADCAAARLAANQLPKLDGDTASSVLYCGGDFSSQTYFGTDSSSSGGGCGGSSCSGSSSDSGGDSGCSSGCSGGCGGGGD